MNDTISREAVADAINGIECTRHTTWYEFYQKVMTAVEKLPPAEPRVVGELISRQVLDLWNKYKPTIAVDAIEYDRELRQLLGTNLAEVGTDCISRQALLDKFEPWLKVKDYNDGELNMLKAILYEIRFMRSAQPEIIRCKDCKHWIPYDWMFSEVWQSKNIADYPEDEIGCDCCDMAMKANDFCSRVERRTE